MAAPTTAPPATETRADISAKTLRTDRWRTQPIITAVVLLAFIGYSTYAAFQNANYYIKPYISPFYSPCIASVCNHARAGAMHGAHVPNVGIVGTWWPISPAIIILIFPLGFRLTCYYYRRAYYRAFWQSPPGCAVAEPHKRYSGESRFPLILQNVHRYFFYAGLLFNLILTYDAVIAFVEPRSPAIGGGHVGVGSFVLLANAVLLWLYSLSCHSCRHVVGGRLKHFSKHPVRFWTWGVVSKLNARHMNFAWASLVFVGLADLYVRLAASGALGNGRWI